MGRQIYHGTALGIALLIAWGTLTPLSVPQTSVGHLDKIFHVMAFGALAMALCLGFPKRALWVVVGVIAYGALIEVVQPHVGRSAEWADLLADALGAILGVVLTTTWARVFREKR